MLEEANDTIAAPAEQVRRPKGGNTQQGVVAETESGRGKGAPNPTSLECWPARAPPQAPGMPDAAEPARSSPPSATTLGPQPTQQAQQRPAPGGTHRNPRRKTSCPIKQRTRSPQFHAKRQTALQEQGLADALHTSHGRWSVTIKEPSLNLGQRQAAAQPAQGSGQGQRRRRQPAQQGQAQGDAARSADASQAGASACPP